MEVVVCGVIILAVLLYNNVVDGKKFFKDNEAAFNMLKEDDFEFLVAAKYGDKVDPNVLYNKRLKEGFIAIVAFLVIFLSELNTINIVLSIVVGYLVFKSRYNSLKKYYKKHLHDIDVMLPYYLKGLEILIQHYTVPVAIAKSIEEAPDIFKPGLRDLIAKIDAGDSSIDPYMDFANEYPVRDSMRMMRLLYRLGLGSQERKQERLSYMESQTMIMLVATGGGVMVLILIAMIYMFSSI